MEEKKYGVCPIMRCQCIGAKCAWWREADKDTENYGCDGWCAVIDISGSISNIDFKVCEDALDMIVHND